VKIGAQLCPCSRADIGRIPNTAMSTPIRRIRYGCCGRAASSRRAAESSDEFAPSKVSSHLALPCEPVDQAGGRGSTGDRRPGADRPRA
jgi:hypothetical protein